MSEAQPSPETSPERQQPSLMDELRERQRDFFKLFGPGIVVTLLGFAIAIYFVEPPPPGELTIATGHVDGNYFAAARKYAHVFQENGVELIVRETAGSLENYELMQRDEVQVAIVQGGTAPDAASGFESLATLYLEPVWVFHHGDLNVGRLSDLAGKRLAVGDPGSGTLVLTRELLAANGVREGTDGTVFVKEGTHAASGLLEKGEVDAAFFVLSADSELVHELLLNDELVLMSFDRSVGYARRYSYLENVVLEPGVVDLERNLPAEPVHLIAPVANLVATSSLHDAFIPLLLEAATEVHESGGFLTPPGTHPSLSSVEFPPNEVARHYLDHGPSFFQKHLSFWVASLIDRTKIMLVPLLILLVPLAKMAPPVYRWRLRSRIYRWYAFLRGVDQALRDGDKEELQRCERHLSEMERELAEVNLPLSYMEEFYNLRLHIDLVKRRLADQQEDAAAAAATKKP